MTDATRGHIAEEPGNGMVERFALDLAEQKLYALLRDLFEHHWSSLVFGILIQGAAWEIRAPQAPTRIGMLDGYLTVDFGTWHFHICIGEHKGTRKAPTPTARSWKKAAASSAAVTSSSGGGGAGAGGAAGSAAKAE